MNTKKLIGKCVRWKDRPKTKLCRRMAKLERSRKSRWMEIFVEFEKLRVTRLTHYLRHREPDTHVNYSILIYRVDAEELRQALDEPVTPR